MNQLRIRSTFFRHRQGTGFFAQFSSSTLEEHLGCEKGLVAELFPDVASSILEKNDLNGVASLNESIGHFAHNMLCAALGIKD